MIVLLNKLTHFLMQCSFFTFLKKVSKKRHPSRIAPLSRSFGMTFSFVNEWAIANKELSVPVSNLLPAITLCRLRFFILCMPRRFFGYFFLFCRSTKKKKVTEELQ